MLRSEKDYIMRMIAAAAAAVARLRERLTGGAQPAEIVAEARAAQGELLGPEVTLLRALDPASAAHAIGDEDRLRAWADLLLIEAEALRKAGHIAEAEALSRRASEISRGSGKSGSTPIKPENICKGRILQGLEGARFRGTRKPPLMQYPAVSDFIRPDRCRTAVAEAEARSRGQELRLTDQLLVMPIPIAHEPFLGIEPPLLPEKLRELRVGSEHLLTCRPAMIREVVPPAV